MKVHPILFVIFVKFHHLNKNKSFWFFSKGLVGGISMPRCNDGKQKRLPNFGTPSDPVQQQLRHITWGLVRSRLAVKSGHPKWWKPDEHGDGGCFLIHPVPSGDEKFRFNQGSGDLLLMGCHNPLFVQNFWIYSWMDMWHVYDMISYYTTVILL